MKKLSISLSLIAGLIATGQVYAQLVTPSQYTVTLSQVDMFRSGGVTTTDFITYAKGTIQVDIAKSAPGKPCAQLQPTGQLKPGNYSKMRFTVAKTMTVQGATTAPLSNGVTCRTTSTGARIVDPFGDGSVSEAYLGATDGAAPEPEVTVVPGGTAVTLPSTIVSSGNNLQATIPMNMNVKGTVPTGTISFGVTNALDFEPLGPSQCIVFPVAPALSVSVG